MSDFSDDVIPSQRAAEDAAHHARYGDAPVSELPPATDRFVLWGQAVSESARTGVRMPVTHDRDGNILPLGTIVDGRGDLWLANGDLLWRRDEIERTPFSLLRRGPRGRRGKVLEPSMLSAFEESERMTALSHAAVTAATGLSSEELDRMSSGVADEPTDYDLDRTVATTPLPEIDAARARHRSACEEKRRRAFWRGFWFGIAVACLALILNVLVWTL